VHIVPSSYKCAETEVRNKTVIGSWCLYGTTKAFATFVTTLKR
jgi:hypothetical protein